MSSHDKDSLANYSNGTKNVCICTIISIFMILVFIISPLNKFVIASMFGKILILAVLIFALYQNISVTFKFSKNIGLFSGDWTNMKTNILCSYVFSAFIIILIFSVLNRLVRWICKNCILNQNLWIIYLFRIIIWETF